MSIIVLNSNIFINILNYFQMSEIKLLNCSFKNNQALIKTNTLLNNKSKIFNQFKRLLITRYFISTQFSSLTQFPILPFETRFMGDTDYLDRIQSNDLSYPIMIGIDKYNRYFISVKYTCLETEWSFDGQTYSINNIDDVYCLTIFQRYTAGSGICKAGRDSMNSSAPLLYNSSTLISKEDQLLFVKNIYRMLVNEPIVYFDYPDKKSNIRSVIKTLNCKLAF